MRTMLTAWLVTLAIAGALAAQEPGDKIRERTARDLELLLPQNGVGGTDKLPLESLEPVVKEIKLEVEGCEKGKAWVAFPAGMDRNRKHALVVTFTDGEETEKGLRDVAKIAGGKDPLLFCGMTYAHWKKITDSSYTYEYLIEPGALNGGYVALMDKVKAEYPVDLDRIFLLGTQGGHGEAMELSQELWVQDPDTYPFRAVLLDGHVIGSHSASPPPVAHIISTDTLFVSRNSSWSDGTRRFMNELIASGIPAQYHEYRGSHTGTAPRRMFILRDAIATLGGPGVPDYPKERPMPGVITESDKVPFNPDTATDGNLRDLYNLAQQEQWESLRERIKTMLDSRTITSKDKRPIKAFEKDLDKYIKMEMDRCHKSVEASVQADMWPHHVHHSRLKALYRAYKDERWVQSKKYAETLEALKTFGPAVRDEERKQLLLKAVKLELEGKREEAKKIYQDLAKQQKEDGGVSDWPFAAEYRLSWWTD